MPPAARCFGFLFAALAIYVLVRATLSKLGWKGNSVAARKASLRIGFSFAAVGMYLFAKEGFR